MQDEDYRLIVNGVIDLLIAKENRSTLPMRYVYNREYDSNTTDFEEMSNADRIALQTNLNDEDARVAMQLLKMVAQNNYYWLEIDTIADAYADNEGGLSTELYERLMDSEAEAYYEVLGFMNSTEVDIKMYELVPGEVEGEWEDFPEVVLTLEDVKDVRGINPNGIVFDYVLK